MDDFVAQSNEELTVKKNDIVVILRQGSSGWWLVR